MSEIVIRISVPSGATVRVEQPDFEHEPLPPEPGAFRGASHPLPNADVCPLHGMPWKTVPAGVSKAGRPYNAFQACPERGCNERPR